MNTNELAVAAVLEEYQDALNQSDTDVVMRLYTSDGVFMPQHFPIKRWSRCCLQGIYRRLRSDHAEGGIQGRRSPPDRPRLGNRAHQFGRNSQS
jgi:hypothetical protein